MFDRSSRYHAIPNAEYLADDGMRYVYKRRRFLPQPELGAVSSASVPSVVVGAGDRLDTVAARALGDPLAFWRIADANGAMDPFALAEPGRRLIIPTIGVGGNKAT